MLLSQEFKEEWSFKSKTLFKFVFTYFSLYIFLMFLGGFFELPFKWIAKNILGISYNFDVSGYGSGDHTYAYVSLFMNVLLTLVAVSVWSFLDRSRNAYNQLLYWFLIALRIVLVAAMLLYGFVKVFQTQFPYPSLTRLLEPVGNFSPMGLAWTYMGYSKGFNIFVGLMEISGGLLLIPRRTQTLGAFVIMGVMTHVFVMNMMFDIPVKLFSFHLVLMATIIFMTDSKRFINVFFKNLPTNSYNYYCPINNKSYHKIIFWIKTIGLTLSIVGLSILGYTTERSRGEKRDRPYLYGIWEAKLFIKDKDTIPPLITDTQRWHYLIIDRKGSAVVKTMNGKKLHFGFKTDTIKQKIKMYKDDVEDKNFNVDFLHLNYSSLEIDGLIENDSLQVFFSRKDVDEFLLHSRGFHWINEQPLNK